MEFELKVNPSEPVENVVPHYRSLLNGQEYSITCVNTYAPRCDVVIKVDGIEVGRWRIAANSSITIERPAGVGKKFTFVKEGSLLASQSGLVSHQDNGLITATFYPEKAQVVPKNAVTASRLIPQGMIAEGPSRGAYSNGGTTLGAESTQKFGTTNQLTEIDESRITTLNLRLVVREEQPVKMQSLRNYPADLVRGNPPPPRWDEVCTRE